MKLSVHLLFNENNHHHEVSNPETYSKLEKLISSKGSKLEGKPGPVVEAEDKTLWSTGGVIVTNSSISELESIVENIFTILNKEVNITLDIYDEESEKGVIYKFKRSGSVKEEY